MTGCPVLMLLAPGLDRGFVPFVDDCEVEVWVGEVGGAMARGDDGEAVEIGCVGVGHVELGGVGERGVRMEIREKGAAVKSKRRRSEKKKEIKKIL